MNKIKTERIASQIVRELSGIIFSEVKDEVIRSITITAADVSPDLSFAKIYYTFMGDYPKENVAEELKNASSYLRTELAERLEIRHTPELKFIFDESIEYGDNIEKILEEIKDK